MQPSTLLNKIESAEAVVAVVGLGYVGLPLAVAFAEAGFRVIGIDIDEERVASLNRGESYVSDVPSERLSALITTPVNARPSTVNSQQSAAGDSLHKPTSVLDIAQQNQQTNPPTNQPTNKPTRQQTLSATTNYNALHDADAVIICVPTPLGKTKDPDMSYVIAATDEIARRLRPDMLIVLESTTYPGTTEELILPRLERAAARRCSGAGGPETAGAEERGSGGDRGIGQSTSEPTNQHTEAHPQPSTSQPATLEVGHDFYLAFSPERIDPGRTDYTVHNTPKVIGGVTPQCLEVAQALYEHTIEKVVSVSSPRVAETVKLLENTFRAVNIALVNEVAIMCDRLGVDVWEVIEAAKTKPFGYMVFYPGPGLGGHCIPIDPEYLAWKLKTVNYNARFIQLAGEVNFGMPQYVLGKIADALNDAGKPLKDSRILILGVAYKADVGDLRESPALDLIHLLREKGADVAYHDPYVPRMNEDGIVLASVTLDPGTLQKSDCVVIVADHSSYDWEWVVENSRLIIDTRNATKGVAADSRRIVKL